jgi:hypothetical protein
MPVAATTYSASISPCSVVTPVTRPSRRVTPVTGVFSRIRTPSWRAPPGQGHGGVGGVAPPVVRVVHRAGQIPGIQRREQPDRLLRGDRLGGDPVGARGRGLAEQFLQAFGAVGQVQGAGLLEPGGEPGLGRQGLEDPQAPADDLAGAVGRPGLGDQAGRVPGRAGGQPLAL